MSEQASAGIPAVEFRGISKHFGAVQALRDVSFTVQVGEVHAIVGENGAGKTTLMNLLGGRIQPDAGAIALHGRVQRIPSPMDALRLGISVVHQEITLCPNMSIAANLHLGREPSGLGGIPNRAEMNRAARDTMRQLDLDIDPRSVVSKLPIAHRQLTEIGRALVWDARVIVMDEPNSALSLAETAALFKVVRKLRNEGVTILFISHRLEEVLEIADRITVLRDGQYMGTLPRGEATVEVIVSRMVGRPITSYFGAAPQPGDPDHTVLEIEGATRAGKFQDVSLRLGRGEVVGLAGLQGAGRKPLARCLFGLDALDAGRVTVGGQPLALRGPADAIRAGIGFVPEDRRNEGLLRLMSIQDNVASVELRRYRGWQVLPQRWMHSLAETWGSRLDLRYNTLKQKVSHLSGGNQQKVVIAKWLATKPRVLILEEPTQGVDVGAKSEIYNLMRTLSAEGVGILFISSELPELLALSSRVLVMHCGKLVAEFSHDEATGEKVMLAATGVACPA